MTSTAAEIRVLPDQAASGLTIAPTVEFRRGLEQPAPHALSFGRGR